MEKFILLKESIRKIKRFNVTGKTVQFRIKSVPYGEEPVTWVMKAVSDIFHRATENLEPDDQVGFTFSCNKFERGEGWFRFQPAKNLKVDDLWEVIHGVFQSNSVGLDTDTFSIEVTSVRLPTGCGKGRKYNSFEEECVKRNGIITISNNDLLCLPRALVVAIAHKENSTEYSKIRRIGAKLQTEKAIQLCKDAGVDISERGAGLKELTKFQEYLKDYKIVVYMYGYKGRNAMFVGNNESSKKLNLIYNEEHFNVITSLTSAFCCEFYCEECFVPYDHKGGHRCVLTCSGCQQSPVCQFELKIKCSDCFRTFKNQNCYDKHKSDKILNNSTVCESIRLCSICFKTVKTLREHICGEIFCKICHKHQPSNHLCFIQPYLKKTKENDALYVFYDLETRQEKLRLGGSFLHEVNLCVFKQFCDYCKDSKSGLCDRCGVTTQILKVNPVERFVEYLLNQRKLFKQVIVIAHNGQAFDHQFILKQVLNNFSTITPEVIMRGTKIVLMTFGNVKFLDSLNYFPMALAKLPKAFGLDSEYKKGYFPHLFNKKKNDNYVGPLPAAKFYSPDTMKPEERDVFFKWYNQQIESEVVFDFKKELVEYCVSDVEILAAACKQFRNLMIQTTNVCPFSEAVTIASACNKVYRRNFLKTETIGIIPKNGYRNRDIQSEIATQWLIWEEKQRCINIRHSAKQQEVIIGGFKVDGFCEETRQIFEFHGCYYHGHPECMKFQRNTPLHDDPSQTLNYRYESTIAKVNHMKNLGYEVIEKWECHFRKELKDNNDLSKIKEHPLLINSPLDPRDAFYGGRTGNCKSYYKIKKGEKIKYLDVCSLYPWATKYGKFPISHPEIFVGKECESLNLSETEGLIKCTILAPPSLYHPVLPQKINNKLMFVLCKSCGESMSNKECNHSEKERALTGTWVIDEVLKSLEKGYRILNIMEIWKYKVVQYDPTKKTGGLFVDMMDLFIKIKTEASGWPSSCNTEEEKNRYIENFLNKEGINLCYEKVSNNPGLRSLAKLMLNSFWGKFGQRENLPKTKFVNDTNEFFSMMTNPALTIHSVVPVDENNLIVNYEFTEETFSPLSSVNVCIAAYTTAQARLKLYSYLELLGERVLYYDTDSVIYIHREGHPEPPTGDYIGDLTDELVVYGIGSYITEFVSGGPKNYAYIVFSTRDNCEKVSVKVKGICLNYETSKSINFESIKKMILQKSEPIHIVFSNIRRTNTHEIVTTQQTKKYRTNSVKRMFDENHDSVPYGFKRGKTDIEK